MCANIVKANTKIFALSNRRNEIVINQDGGAMRKAGQGWRWVGTRIEAQFGIGLI